MVSTLYFERKNLLERSNESILSVLRNSESKSERGFSNKSNFNDAKIGLQKIK